MARSVIANRRANEAWKKGDYKTALSYAQQAYAYYPSESNRDDVATVQKAAQQQQDAMDSQQRTNQALSQINDTIKRTEAATVGTSSSLEFASMGGDQPVKPGSGTKFFGKADNPDNPDIGKLSQAKEVAVESSLTRDRLSSIDKSGKNAVTGQKIEDAKDNAGCGFDKGACEKPGPTITVDKSIAQTPAAREILSHIPDRPDVRNDPAIRTNIALYSHLENLKADKQGKIDEIQSQIKADPNSAGKFAKDLNALSTDVKNLDRDQANAASQIKESMKKNYGLEWIENPLPAEGQNLKPQ